MSDNIDAAMLAKVLEAQALLAANKDLLKAHASQRKTDLGTLGEDFLAHVVETGEYKESDSSDWAGFSESGIPFEGKNGRSYTATLTITDTSRKDARAKERKAAEEAAKKAPVVVVS